MVYALITKHMHKQTKSLHSRCVPDDTKSGDSPADSKAEAIARLEKLRKTIKHPRYLYLVLKKAEVTL